VRERALAQGLNDGRELRQPDLTHGGADGEGIGQVVDVLTRAGEVGELGDVVESQLGELATHEVLNGLDVMTGGRLEGREFVDLGLAEVGDERAQLTRLLRRDTGRPEEFVVRQVQEPLHLDTHPRAVEARLGQVLTQLGDGGTVATIQRADWLFGQWAHETPCRMPGVIWRKSEVQAFSIMPRTRSNMAASE
jgi:hypothetical protein